MSTLFAKKGDVERRWYLVDAKDAVLGRLAVKIANYLRGKNKPIFTPNYDTGDFVIVVNADKVKLTGKKLDNKIYYSHSGYPGGIKAETARDRLSRCPEKVLTDAVWGMIPKGRLGRAMIKKLKVYRGTEHPHKAQKPEILSV
ncbi:MAG: 50S ribosomal protein L13 [Nitrospirae bacterium CG_4_10_14_0_8_um_filter_41_23]|nr:50S ribosomal protein L13 [Nitrospirota bacterium]OIP59833.1 MAG: 50S ribosomal protein L13 [Nitrospirae bacterium CG2_30_41_42]PIQ93187.1 MAG: 50S ribosomal protein L13 [Nitrospirae bacterium CG11_big_fil_rev_8_21_14_0_20_41_14]PIV44738.1 MAG: 50S ribosomal protein L13 [Nitrospirae bacterium CG02_land_8_20_14_3_00_41_53]PIW87486.1 MAG: 50S ribosomal protein L13 [Nitrospirae bacterium CG_4_8_14_3_um_filter_41_47]PIY87920.1 MAG: 50S ribosomal protein L13 [Nitrospirae bacterium CG_4_10_14_0_8